MFKYNETTFTEERLNGMNSMALVALYNAIARQLGGEHDKPVNRFSDKKTAVDRITKVGKLLEVRDQPTPRERSPERSRGTPRQEQPRGARKGREMRFVFPVKGEIKGHRADTHRATLIKLLSQDEGATFVECQEATGWDKKTTYEGIRLLHYYVGYGMRQDDAGRIYLRTK